MKKNLAYYKNLPYTLRVERFEEEEDGRTYFCASYQEMPHVKGVHENRLIAVRLAKELFDDYVEAQLEWGREIEEPDVPRYRKRGGLWKFSLAGPTRSAAEADLVEKRDEPGDVSGVTGGIGSPPRLLEAV
jgi:hypothetical protein